MAKWFEKTRYRRILLLVLALISIGLVGWIIAVSTDHDVETIYVESDGAQIIKTTNVQILLSDEDNEALSGLLVSLDDLEELYRIDETGLLILKDLPYGNHILHIETLDGKKYDYPFRMTIDFDLSSVCVITLGEYPHIQTPSMVTELMFQLVLQDGVFYLTEHTVIRKETGSVFLSDGTEMLPDGRIYFPGGDYVENGYLHYLDGESRKIGEGLLITESGTIVFPDGTLLSDSRAFYYDPSIEQVRILGRRAADLHNGYYKDEDGIVIDEYGNQILMDGSVVFSDDVVVPPGSYTLEEAMENAEDIRNALEEITETKTEIEKIEEETEEESKETKETVETKEEPEKNTPEESGPKIDPASVEEYSNQTWIQASKLHIFSDADELSGGAFLDENGKLVIAPGSKGTYHFRIATKNQRVSFIFKLYHTGDLSIPMKLQLVYPDGHASDWVDLKNSISVETALAFEEVIAPSNTYTYYSINWWWDEGVDDTYDTQVGIQAASEIVNYEVYAVLQVTTE